MAKQEDVTLNVTMKISIDDGGVNTANAGEIALSKAAVKMIADAVRREIVLLNSGGFTNGDIRPPRGPLKGRFDGPSGRGVYVHGAMPLSSGWVDQRDVPRGNDISLERARQRVAEATDAL